MAELNASVMVDVLHLYVDNARVTINDLCSGLEAWAIIGVSVFASLVLVWLYDFLFQEECIKSRLKSTFFRIVKKIPMVRNKIAKEMEKTKVMLETELAEDYAGLSFIKKMPEKGLTKEKILAITKEHIDLGKVNWRHGRVSGCIYNFTDELSDLTRDVYGICSYTNPLHADVFPGIRKLESEVVRVSCTLFNGGPESCGVMTTGGTESIIMACKAYRDSALERGIKLPEIVLPITAHAAFDKAAAMMRIRLKHVPVDPVTFKVNLSAMKRAISKNTCMLVGSAPNFPHGIIDDIEAISKLGVKYNIPLHVDGCLGGFLLPFMEKAGYPLPPFDFRLPGVTSISADTHKYGSAPKGSSVILYRDESYRHYQFFVVPDWPGGIYASPSLPGSRAGGIIAACWAAMMYIGEEGYVNNTRKIIQAARTIDERLRAIPGIKVIGSPQMSVVAFTSDQFDIYRLTDTLSKRGWSLNVLQFPSCVHMCATVMHTYDGVVDSFIKDVEECTADLLKDPNGVAAGKAAIYGMSQSIPDRTMVSDIARRFLDACYSTSLPLVNVAKA